MLTVGAQVLLGDLEVLVGRLVDSRNVEDVSLTEQLETLEWSVGSAYRPSDKSRRLSVALANLAFSVPLRVANLLTVVRARLTELRQLLTIVPLRAPASSIGDWSELSLDSFPPPLL